MWKDFELRTPRMTLQSVKSIRNHKFSFTTNPVQLSPLDSLTQKGGTWTNEQSFQLGHSSYQCFHFQTEKNQIQVDASSSKSIQMPSYSSRNEELNSKTHPLAIPLISAFKSRGDTWVERWQPMPWNPLGTGDTPSSHTWHTWPSQRSMSGTFSRLALMSLVWNNFPSKYIQGQQCSQGMGCPQASLAKRAISTPLMKRADSWIPRGSRFSICSKTG